MTSRAVHSFPSGGSGGGGSSTPAAPITYVQHIAVPDTTWTVTHPLDTLFPSVELWGEDRRWLGDADMFVQDNSTVIITWAVPLAGWAKISV